MARGFRIHSSAVFDPFSYQEMLAPIAQAQTAYNQMQDSLLAAGEEANQYRQLIDSDEYASGILKGYNDALADMSGRLSSEGLRSVNRNSLLNLRRRYNNEVKPINDAAKTLASLQDMYRQAYAKDQTMMRGAMPSIRDLVENPGATPHMVSGSSLYSQGNQAAKNASGRKYEYNARVNNLVNGYIRTVERSGYNSVEAQQFLDAASRQPELQAIVNQIYGANRVDMLDNPQQGMDWIVRGVFDGLAYNEKNDLKFDQYGAEMRAAARAQAAAKATKTGASTFGAGIDSFNLYSQKERTTAAKNIDKYKDMFTQVNGSWVINDKGRSDLRKENYSRPAGTSITGATQGQIPFGSGMKSVLEKYTGKSLNSEKDIEDAWTRYYNEHQNETYDATKRTGYRYIPQSDDKTTILQLFEGHSNKGEIPTVDYDEASNKYVKDGSINIKDITSISDIEMTPVGFVVNVGTKNNGSVKLKMPDVGGKRLSYMQNYMFPEIEYTRDYIVQYLQSKGYGEYIKDPDAAIYAAQTVGDINTVQELGELLSIYEKSIQNLHNEMSNIYRPTNAKEIVR